MPPRVPQFVDNDPSQANRIDAAWLNAVDAFINAAPDPNDLSFSPATSYTAGTLPRALADRVWSITDAPWSAVGDGVTDNAAAIAAAQTALAAAGGGTLLIPEGSFRYTTAIARVDGVDFVGLGWKSILRPDGCSAFTYGYNTGFGHSLTANLRIYALNGTAQIAIHRPGTLDVADEQYGITIENCAITGFNSAIQLSSARYVTIRNNWIQDVNSGIHLIGVTYNVFIENNKIVKAAGSGVGTQYGIVLQNRNYTTSGGTRVPEGVRSRSNLIYGFSYGIYISDGIEVRSLNDDIMATIVGVVMNSVVSVSVESGYIEMTGGSVQFGLWAPAQGSSNNSKYTIRSCKFLASGGGIPANASGVMLGTRAVTGNQDGYTIENNEFIGWTGFDIEQYACGDNVIKGNRCLSTGTTNSMSVTGTAVTRPTFVNDNHFKKSVTLVNTEAGYIQGKNVVNDTVLNDGVQLTHSTAGAISLQATMVPIVTTAPTAFTLADGYNGQEQFYVMTSDGGDGVLTPANLFNGTTITFNDVGDSAHLKFIATQWVFMGGTATLA